MMDPEATVISRTMSWAKAPPEGTSAPTLPGLAIQALKNDKASRTPAGLHELDMVMLETEADWQL
jgi:hypothetical protein